MEIVLEHSYWYIPLCILGGLIYAFALYYEDRTLEFTTRYTKALMFTMRFLTSTVLLLFLLSPMMRTQFSETEDPVVVVIQDNSESILAADSSAIKDAYLKEYENFIGQLDKSLDVRPYLTGSSVRSGNRPDFTDKESDLSSVVDVVQAQFAGRNLAAIILASDGLYNKGSNPVYKYQDLIVPVHVIPMGDTLLHADVRISRVRSNNKALLGNTFPVEVFVNAEGCDGQTVSLKIESDGNILREEDLRIRGNRFSRSLIYYLDADKKGLQHYTASISGSTEDYSSSNNKKDFFIDIIDRREKVLILAGAPHPDISFIRNTLENTLTYDVTTSDAFSYSGIPSDNDLVIFHGIPKSGLETDNLFRVLGKTGIPYLIILGPGSDIRSLDPDFIAMQISDNGNRSGDVQAILTSNFSLFELNEDRFRTVQEYPPLLSPFGTYQPKKEVRNLLFQRIGQVPTEMPLLYFSEYQDSRIGVLAGEGIWKWGFYEQREQAEEPVTSQLLLKCVQYLLATGKHDPLNLFHKQAYHENENVIIDAELLNASGEYTNEPDLVLKLTNEEEEEFDFAFSRKRKGYTLNMGSFTPGLYSFRATAQLGNNKLEKRGQIRISPLQVEFNETKADHQLLRTIASKTNGGVYYPGKLNELTQHLVSDPALKPVVYNRSSLDDVINLWQILALLILMLATEWILRKRSGSY